MYFLVTTCSTLKCTSAGVSNLFYTTDRLRFEKIIADRVGGGLWMGSLKHVYSFILLSAHVEVDLSLREYALLVQH